MRPATTQRGHRSRKPSARADRGTSRSYVAASLTLTSLRIPSETLVSAPSDRYPTLPVPLSEREPRRGPTGGHPADQRRMTLGDPDAVAVTGSPTATRPCRGIGQGRLSLMPRGGVGPSRRAQAPPPQPLQQRSRCIPRRRVPSAQRIAPRHTPRWNRQRRRRRHQTGADDGRSSPRVRLPVAIDEPDEPSALAPQARRAQASPEVRSGGSGCQETGGPRPSLLAPV